MRRARITFINAYHHVMNRGLNGCDIFFDSKSKLFFLNLLYNRIIKYKIKLFAFCIMNNHYHLIIQNSSGKMAEFMKQLNGEYGQYYRLRKGGRGYVFQNRYKSTLIQHDKYMKMCIVYTLLNPIRKGIIDNPFQYKWSSIQFYYTKNSVPIDSDFVEQLFKTKQQMTYWLDHWKHRNITVKRTRFGDVVADDDFFKEAIMKFNRRIELDNTAAARM